MQMTEDRPGHPVFTSMCQRHHSPLDCTQSLRPEPTPSHTNPRPLVGDQRGGTGMPKSAPSALHDLPFSAPRPGGGGGGQVRDTPTLPRRREGQARRLGSTEHLGLGWVFRGGDLSPTCHGGRGEAGGLVGWGRERRASSAPEYQGPAPPLPAELPRRPHSAPCRRYTCVCMRCWKRCPKSECCDVYEKRVAVANLPMGS